MVKLSEMAKAQCEKCRQRLKTYKIECPFIHDWDKYCGAALTIDAEEKVLKRFQDALIYDKYKEME